MLGEAQIWTQPTGAVGGARRYLAGTLDAASAPSKTAWAVVPFVGRDQVGAMFAIMR